MQVNFKPDSRCPICGTLFNKYFTEKAGTEGCPMCKTMIPMLKVNQDGYIKINWADLRMLAVYAQRWARRFDMTKKGNFDSVRRLENVILTLEHFKPQGADSLIELNEPVDPSSPTPSPYYKKFKK